MGGINVGDDDREIFGFTKGWFPELNEIKWGLSYLTGQVLCQTTRKYREGYLATLSARYQTLWHRRGWFPYNFQAIHRRVGASVKFAKHGSFKYCCLMWLLPKWKVSKSVRWRPGRQVILDGQMTFLWGCICSALALRQSWPFHSVILASIHQQNAHPLLTHTGIKHVNGSWLSERIVLLLCFGGLWML